MIGEDGYRAHSPPFVAVQSPTSTRQNRRFGEEYSPFGSFSSCAVRRDLAPPFGVAGGMVRAEGLEPPRRSVWT